jgi:chromatin modification-related protein VID21
MLPNPPKDARKRAADLVWTPAEDQLLRSLVDKYPNNWPLVADSFNSSRVTIATDKRTPWDCHEHWSVRWGPGSRLAPSGGQGDQRSPVADETPPPATPSVGQMTTRGVKRASIAASNANSGVFTSSSGNESRKRRRHSLMVDAMRKAAKRKEAAQKANRKCYLLTIPPNCWI